MASTFDNNLRLREMGTGDESGTWGARTNENLELIGEALGFGTEAITTNADTHTTTIADGSTDPGRAMYLKYTGALDSACTITLAPDTISKLWFIENATSGSQNIIIKQGSGSTVTIPASSTKLVYSDGAGSGAAMVDALDKIDLGTNAKLNDSGIASGNSTTTLINKSIDSDNNTITNIVNADIKSTAAIAFSKMADLTASRALVSDSNGDVSVSAVTSTELGYLDGVSSAIQTQLNTKGTSSFSGSYNDLSSKPTIPTNNNQLSNGAGYLTSSTLASYYASSTTSGYIRFANGFQMCWARQTTSFSGTWTFPLAFPNACVGVSKHDERSSSSGNGENYVYNISASSVAYTSGDTGSKTLIAVGY